MDKNALLEKAKAKKTERDYELQKQAFEGFVTELSTVISRGIQIDGLSELSAISLAVETFGQRTSDLVETIRDITCAIPDLSELSLPGTIELKSVTDDLLLKALEKIGDDGLLLQKFESLDVALGLLSETISKAETPGETVKDPAYVRIVLGAKGSERILENWPIPQFYGGSSGGGTSGGLTDTELRASPVPVSGSLSIDPTGLATDTGQDEIVAAIEAIPTTDVSALSTSANQTTIISAVDGIEAALATLIAATQTVYSKPTDIYAIQAISDDGTYKYYFYEAANKDWYVMRKHIANNVFSYVKGTGGYESVYQSAILGPSGSPTYDSYGDIF